MSISTVCIRVPLRSLLLERRGANKSGGVKLPTLKHLKQSNCLGIKKNVRRNSCILKVHNIGKQMFIRQKKKLQGSIQLALACTWCWGVIAQAANILPEMATVYKLKGMFCGNLMLFELPRH